MIRAARCIRENREGAIQDWITSSRRGRQTSVAGIGSFAARLSDNGNMSESGLKVLVEEIRNIEKVEREISLNDVADYTM